MSTPFHAILAIAAVLVLGLIRLNTSSSSSSGTGAESTATTTTTTAGAKENDPAASNQNDIANDTNATFNTFRFRYLTVYLMMVAADWLQGPYVFALYSTYGFSKAEIAQLFVVGFGASMLVGTFVGSLADSMGRRRFGLLYCVLYIMSCATKHFNDYWILMLGRLLGGTATSLLFSVFESWLVCANNTRGFGEERLSSVFSAAIFGNSVVAILSGIAAQAAAEMFPMTKGPFVYFGGYTGPFDLSAMVLIVGGFVMSLTWEENYGDRKSSASIFSTSAMRSALSVIANDRAVLLCGLIQSLFEGAMYSFVFEWTPALREAETAYLKGSESGSVDLPYGIIFATFMVACMGGSQLFSRLIRNHRPATLLPYVFGVSAVSLASVPLERITEGALPLTYYGFLVFEVCVGMYFPLISTIKSQIVPESSRSTIYNLFRVPLNAIVLFVLLNDFSVDFTFSLCVALLALASLLQMRLSTMLTSQAYQKLDSGSGGGATASPADHI